MKQSTIDAIREHILEAFAKLEQPTSTNSIKNKLPTKYGYKRTLETLEHMKDDGEVSVEEIEKGKRVFREWTLEK